jgi:hypothetical protein
MAGANIFHYSNVGFRVPNSGVNVMEIGLGLSSRLRNTGNRVHPDRTDSLRHFFEVSADVGWRGSFKVNTGNWKSGFYIGYNRKLMPIWSGKIGFDAVYYYKVFDGTVERFQYYGTSYDHWRYGISIGSDLWLGKLAVLANYGYYLKYNSYYPIKRYWSTGLKYYLKPWLGLQGKVYSHKSQAEFVGFGLTFRVAAGLEN